MLCLGRQLRGPRSTQSPPAPDLTAPHPVFVWCSVRDQGVDGVEKLQVSGAAGMCRTCAARLTGGTALRLQLCAWPTTLHMPDVLFWPA